MELKFNEAEIKDLILVKAWDMGIEANTVDFEVGYSSLRSATVSFVKPENSPQALPASREPIKEIGDTYSTSKSTDYQEKIFDNAN